ncbi:hypothetical protein [Anaeromassilibacillus sp. 1001302B_160321_C8]|uniref:hypothetical protein n=1 Tax=Anaeromassilibacillus sp. 1001302B_160321_C8 TaxID=2787132 RepID=UPI001897E5F2|nr:hypothetical protein [Anaeromassilibacillus sp. 1001302B_160321_C8]
MALKDSSGRITIDEYAAQQDIQKINQAKAALENSKKAIENLINQASNEQGQTAVAIVEKATELRNQINTMIGRLNETSSFISSTIAHYQEVDRLVKEAIQNSMRAQAAAAAASSSSKPASQPAAQPSAPKQTTSSKTSSSKASSSKKSSSKKSSKNDFVDDVVDAISDAFKKWF